VHAPGLAQILEGAAVEARPGRLRRAWGELLHGASAVHDLGFLFRAVCVGVAAGIEARDADELTGDGQLRRRFPHDAARLLVEVVPVAADREIPHQTRHGPETLDGVLDGRRPVAVGDDAHLESQAMRQAHRVRERGVVEEGLTPFEVDPLHAAEPLRLGENLANLRQTQRADLVGATPHEAVVALEVALVGQKQMHAVELHVSDRSDEPAG
jgi:hypothetical protein